MKNIVMHDSFERCLDQIQRDFQVDVYSNKDHRTLLLRGESADYAKTESSMKRFLTSNDGKTMNSFYYAAPFIDFEEICTDYYSENFDLTEEEAAGFLQHYGFPTDLLDFTPSIETVRFFASYGNGNSDVSLIGAFPRIELEDNFVVTDLSNHPIAERPQRQMAYTGRPSRGIIDLKDEHTVKLLSAKWYKFRKNATDIIFAQENSSLLYPSESELAHFFEDDFDDFFKEHWANSKYSIEQRQLVESKLESIRTQLN